MKKRCEIFDRTRKWPYVIRCQVSGVKYIRPPGESMTLDDELWCCARHAEQGLEAGGTEGSKSPYTDNQQLALRIVRTAKESGGELRMVHHIKELRTETEGYISLKDARDLIIWAVAHG